MGDEPKKEDPNSPGSAKPSNDAYFAGVTKQTKVDDATLDAYMEKHRKVTGYVKQHNYDVKRLGQDSLDLDDPIKIWSDHADKQYAIFDKMDKEAQKLKKDKEKYIPAIEAAEAFYRAEVLPHEIKRDNLKEEKKKKDDLRRMLVEARRKNEQDCITHNHTGRLVGDTPWAESRPLYTPDVGPPKEEPGRYK